jgi:hypothetical protein
MLPTTTQDTAEGYGGDKNPVSKFASWANSIGSTESPRLLRIVIACGVVLVTALLLLPSTIGSTGSSIQVGDLA